MKINLGGFNDVPPNWRKITADEFANKLNHREWDKIEFRQMHGKPFTVATDGQLFIYSDGTGIAVCQVWSKKYNMYKGRFYAFGCEHTWKSIPWRKEFGPHFSCNTAYKCKRCGKVEILDSSD